MQHKVFCPMVTGEVEICTCGALFRADWIRPYSDVSTPVKARQLPAVDGDALAQTPPEPPDEPR